MYGPKRPDMYEISLKSVIKDQHEHQQQTQVILYPTDHENTVVLILNDSIIQPNNLYMVNISASNSAGSAIIIQDLTISKYYWKYYRHCTTHNDYIMKT